MLRIIFITLFFLLLYLKDIYLIALSLVSLIIISLITDKNLKILLKTIKSVILFNLGVSIGYLIFAIFKNISPWHYLAYINLKVILMTLFVFYFFSKVSLVEFFSFNKELSYLLTISLSQIFSYKKTFEDFKMAFRARVYKLTDKSPKFITRTFEFFFQKALKDSRERTLAMKARGFFND